MKKYNLLILLLSCLLLACKDDSISTGDSILDATDEIIVNTDTFNLSSSLYKADYIYSTPDSFLLGECDNRFGTIHADIFTQMACPIGFEFPENSEVDSVDIYLYYQSWFGDGNSPMQITIHEMDKETFNYSTAYPSNIAVSTFCSYNDETKILENDRIVVADKPTDSIYLSSTQTYMPYIRLKTTKEFAKRFFNNADYSSQEAFNTFFKGLYITSNFGSSTMFHIFEIDMILHYHFTYSVDGKDTTVTDSKAFYANKEVRQVNRIKYTNSKIQELEQYGDSINFIVSPANIYTRLSLPMNEMSNHIKGELGDCRPYVNRARLIVDILNYYSGSTTNKTVDNWAQPAANMLLIKESAISRFFEEKELPTDTCALLGSFTSGSDANGNVIYYYSYDLSALLTQQLRTEQDLDTLHMVLIPVTVETTTSDNYYSSSTSISGIKPQQTISATTIRSAQDSNKPMQLEVVYSGF